MRILGARVMVGLGLVALGLIIASPRAEAAPKPEAAPAELLATVAIGPVTTLRGLTAYLEAVSPGAGEGLSDRVLRRQIADAVGVSSLDGIDPASWMYLLVVSTGDAPAIGLLGKVADAKALTGNAGGSVRIKRGWAVLGAKPVLDRVGSYALAALTTQPVPKAPNATLYVPHLLDRYRSEIDLGRKQMQAQIAQTASADRMAQMMTSFVDGFLAALGDVEQVSATVEATRDLVALDLALAPRPRSRLAGFVALQRPSDHALLGKLPAATSPAGVIAGHIEAGPYHDGMIDLSTAIFGAGAQDLRATLDALLKTTTGDFGATLQLSPAAGMSVVQLFGVSDAAAANRAIAGMLDVFKGGRVIASPEISTKIETLRDAPTHDGVALRGYHTTYDLSKTPPAQRKTMERIAQAGGVDTRMAAFDGVGTIVTGPDSIAAAGRLIDAARGKAARFAPPAAIAEFLAGSRTRKESLAMVLDMAGILALVTGRSPQGGQDAPLLLSLGFADRRAHIRIAAPVASMRAAVAAGQP